MAFRSLSLGGKIVIGACGAGVVGAVIGFYVYPVHRHKYFILRNIAHADSLMIGQCEKGWKRLQDNDECQSLLKKYLTKSVLDKLKTRRTVLGGTLWHIMESGLSNPEDSLGVFVPDYEAYSLFKEVLNPIIQEYHGVGSKQEQPPVDLGEEKLDELAPLDTDGKYIQSTKIVFARSIKVSSAVLEASLNYGTQFEKLEDFPFNTLMTEDDYYILEQKFKLALQTLTDPELRGQYYPMYRMDKETEDRLIQDNILFKDSENDRRLKNGGDVRTALDRLIRAVKAFDGVIPFARDKQLGWYTYRPANLGSAVRASVHVKLPKVSARINFQDICEKLNLQVRRVEGSRGGGVYDVSNKRTFGISEFDAVKEMYDGVKTLIEMETSDS